jgi:hypothetical protein
MITKSSQKGEKKEFDSSKRSAKRFGSYECENGLLLGLDGLIVLLG